MDAAANNWESLVAQVKDQLHAMSPDEFCAGARQLQMLAHSEAGKRGEQHHFDAPPNFVAVGQPIVQAYDGAADRPAYAFVSVSPVKSSRAGVANPAWHPPPGYPCMPPPLPPQQMHPFIGFEAPQPSVSHPAYSHPPVYAVQGQGLHVDYPAGASSMPSPASYLVRSSQATPMRAHSRGSIYTPTRMSANPQGLETALPEYTFDSLLLDLGAATPIRHCSTDAIAPEAYQPTAATKMQRTQTASKWSDICFSEPSIEAKEEAEEVEAEAARPKRKRGQGKAITAGVGVAQPSKRSKAKPTSRWTSRKREQDALKAKGEAVAAISEISKEVKSKAKAATKAKASRAKRPPTKANRPPTKAKKATVDKTSRKKGQGPNVVTDLDVLKGRGGLTNHHAGNVRFRAEARKILAVYRSATREEKTLLSQELVERVKEYGGRFLQDNGGQWHQVDDGVARKKASQVLRDL